MIFYACRTWPLSVITRATFDFMVFESVSLVTAAIVSRAWEDSPDRASAVASVNNMFAADSFRFDSSTAFRNVF
ncbi:MAG: hypothetical protein AUF67_01895 [Acidobacteria bacterium 13_1_20CM_58_21]|nr:MAG: hypothetical protein AUF67_01895 [Acidobacteria bacterium 13_1_20CM_58_21]